MPEAEQTTHIGDRGLWIPPELREFQAQIVFRTPRATIQHFQSGGGELDPYYGMIDESHFGPAEEIRDPRNAALAPDRVSIKPQGEEPVELVVEIEPEVRCDGGDSEGDSYHGCHPPEREKMDCDRCGDEEVIAFADRDHPVLCDDCEEYVANLEPPDEGREITPMDRRWR